MSRRLKVGLIGCGNVVNYGHRPALTTLPDVELIALADITQARRAIGKDWFQAAKTSSFTQTIAT